MDLRVGFPKTRVLGTPALRRRTLAAGAEQAEAWAAQAYRVAGPHWNKLYGIRRRLATATVAVLAVWLFVHVMFGANGMAVYRTKRAEYQDLKTQINQLEKTNDQYAGQIDQLKRDPKRIEREAREQFHYARPGEVIYVAPEIPPSEPAAPHSASK